MRAMTKVFVSSKQDELAAERAALTEALRSPEWDNFTFEWSGAFSDSARDVYLKQVAEANAYLGVFYKSYSQPTVDEYHEARRLGKPILVYLKDCAKREDALMKFITEELYPAHKCQSFKTTEELVSHLPDIRRALDAEVQKHQRQAYLDALVAQTELLELAGIIDTGEQERPKLQEIFVALSAAEEVEERDERQPKDKRERERPIKTTRRVTINEALREHRHLMILGDPGAGKSTLLRYLTLVAAQGSVETLHATSLQESRLPILIRLSSFARSGQSFVEYFETYAKTQLHVSLGGKFFERSLEDGQAIVCLDGLDEVSQPAQRIEVRNAITALSARYPRNRFIVTSRVAGYDSASLDKRAFAHHTIVPFGEKEIQSFVKKWYAAREQEPEQAKTRAANLFNDLKANERLLKLAENPLMLTIIALVHQRALGKLPDARVELYDRCAETLIEEWDKWKGLAPEDRERPYYQLRRRLLERAAYWMHVESQEADVAQISKRALEMKVAEFLVEDKTLNLSEDTAGIEAKQFVALATSRTGILVEREQGAVSFIHLTFQEYFAASDLYWRYRRTSDALWQAIQPHLYDSRWLEVILLLLGRLNDDGDTPSIIVEKILREHDKFDDVIHRDLFLAAKCLADQVNVKESLQNKIVDKLSELASTPQPRYVPLRDDAIKTLGTLRSNKRAGDALLALAQDEKIEFEVRIAATQRLGQLRRNDNAVIQGLLTLAQNKGIPLLEATAADVLGRIERNDDAVIQSLLALAQNDKIDGGVRFTAAQALGRLGRNDDEVQLLLVLAQTEKIAEGVRRAAVEALGQMRHADNAVIQGLLALAQDEKVDGSVRCASVEALGQLGCTDNAVIQGLLALAQDEKVYSEVRRVAVQALGNLGYADDVTIQILLMLAQNEKIDSGVQASAVWVLGKLESTDDSIIQSLLELTQDTQVSGEVKNAAQDVLVHLGRKHDSVIHSLLVLLQEEKNDRNTKHAASYVLGLLGRRDDVVIQGLLALVQDEKTHAIVRSNAAHVLGELGCTDDVVIQGLLALVQDKNADAYVRSYTSQVLKQLGREDDLVIQALLELAQDEKVQRLAGLEIAQALGQWGCIEVAVQLLVMLAQDEKTNFLINSPVEQLAQLGRTEDTAIQALVELAKDEKIHRPIRLEIAQALGQLGRIKDAVQLVLTLVQDEEIYEGARCNAVEKLAQLGHIDDVVNQGFLTLAHNQKIAINVRCTAVYALGQSGVADSAVIQGLMALARDEKVNVGVQSAAVYVLGQLGQTDDAVRLLLMLAQDARVDNFRRGDATKALGQLGKKEPRVALALLKLASVKDSGVRNTAYDALKEIVVNLRYDEITGRRSASSWLKMVRTRFLAPFGMTESKIAN